MIIREYRVEIPLAQRDLGVYEQIAQLLPPLHPEWRHPVPGLPRPHTERKADRRETGLMVVSGTLLNIACFFIKEGYNGRQSI